MENLVGRKVLCTESLEEVTEGKEYTITNVDNSGFYIIEDDGKKQNWCTSHLQSKEYFELLPKEPKFKQGDKVLVSDDKNDWAERIFVTKHRDLYYTEKDCAKDLLYWKHIKPYEEEIKCEIIWKI